MAARSFSAALPLLRAPGGRPYAMDFAGMTVRFTGDVDAITVVGVE